MKQILIQKIVSDGLQARAATDQETVQEYAEAIQAGSQFPPVTVYSEDESVFFLADGFHRLRAHIQLGMEQISAEVHPGTRDDAAWHSVGSNKSHGLRRTNADKRRAVERALEIHPELSSRTIADHCGVSHTLVDLIRGALALNANARRVTCDGREYPATRKAATTLEIPPVPPEAPKIDYGPPPEIPKSAPVSEPTVILDKVGVPIPPQVLPYFERSQEVQDGLTMISRLKGAMRKAMESEDPLYAEVNFNRIEVNLRDAYETLALAMPYAVCPFCQGKLNSTCRACKRRGFVSEFLWKTVVPTEMKQATPNQQSK